MEDLLKQAEHRVPTLAGVKFTHFDLMDFHLANQVNPERFQMLFGRDEYLLGSLPFGTKAAVGSTYNFMGKLYLRLMEAYQQSRLAEAKQLQTLSHRVIAIMKESGDGVACSKAITNLALKRSGRGFNLGPSRLPIISFSEEKLAWLEQSLDEIEFFDFSQVQN